MNAWLSDTITSVFPNVYVTDVPASTNRILFASVKYPEKSTYFSALERVLTDENGKRSQTLPFLNSIPDRLNLYEGKGRLLTDDCAPVELLGMQAIDGIITYELSYYRRLYQQEGLSGLLNALL